MEKALPKGGDPIHLLDWLVRFYFEPQRGLSGQQTDTRIKCNFGKAPFTFGRTKASQETAAESIFQQTQTRYLVVQKVRYPPSH